jgi:D-glycero-D-manno-heptose 1,7-bisphosphate phosphatase
MKKAVFLDRDGVINRERNAHTWRLEDLEVLPTVPEALRKLQDAGWTLVVITNQSGIGLGLYDHADVDRVHAEIARLLAVAGVQLDDVLYCPHHPQEGRCLCRKPGSLLLERAMAKHGIDPARSVMVGDRERDVQAAGAAGIRGILVASNSDLLELLSTELPTDE